MIAFDFCRQAAALRASISLSFLPDLRAASARLWMAALALLQIVVAPAVCAQTIAVSESGTPSYSFPIVVPPGIAGMTPNLGLTYTAGGVNGPVGYGWSIQGISTITRCPNTKGIDGTSHAVDYTGNDKLCLDGQRLIQTDAGGTSVVFPQTNDSLGLSSGVREYRTEKDSFARVRAYGMAGGAAANGPAYFKVWTKSGQIYEYGNNANTSANSAITAQGKTVVAAWAVSRISDTLGNYIDFQYEQRDTAWGSGTVAGSPTPGHEWNLIEMRYTGTATQAPANKVVFEYGDRATAPGSAQDRAETYHQGAKNVSIRRLNAIRTYINATATPVKVKTIKLTYDHGPVTNRSRVKSITECAGTAETQCLPSTSFTYSAGGSDAYTTNANFNLGTQTLLSQAGNYGVLPGDFVGAGRTSIIRWSENPAENQLWASDGNGHFTQVTNFNITDQILFKSDGCYTTLAADVNGDGLPDLLRYSAPTSLDGSACASYGPVYIYLNNGGGTFSRRSYSGPDLTRRTASPFSIFVSSFIPQVPPGANFFLLDVDGDGQLDIVTTIIPSRLASASADPCTSSTVCTHVFKGDGKGNFVEISTNLAHVSVYVAPGQSSGVGTPNNIADLDGDGFFDLVGLNTATSYNFNLTPAYRSRGDGNFDPVATGQSCTYPIDFNGDGRNDCLAPDANANPAANKLQVADGSGAMPSAANFNLTQSSQELAGTGVGIAIMDTNQDGRQDILRWKDSPSQNTLYLSNGEGSFTASATFNLAGTQLKKSDNSFDFITGDFTGHGNVEILRLGANVNGSGNNNQLYVKQDSTPPDQLLTVTTGSGLVTSLYYASLSNATPNNGVSANLGLRYTSDRGTDRAAVYPKVDITAPMYVVATSVADSGVGGEKVTTEYAYTGLKASYDGRGAQGFRETRRQSPAPDGTNLTVVTQYLQDHPYTGVAVQSETRLGALNASFAQVLSRSTYVYCEKAAGTAAEAAATSTAPCPVTAKIQRPYLYQSTEAGWDIGGVALPTVTTTNTFNNSGDPTQIVVSTTGTTAGLSQTSTKTTTNQYFADNTAADNWILGRLQKATQRSTVLNSLASIPTSTHGSPYLGVPTAPVSPSSPPSPISPATLSIILQFLLND